MRARRGIIFWLILFLFIAGDSVCFGAEGAKQKVKEANALYQKGKLDEALQKYNEAGITMPDSDIINFNTGAALYKKGDYQKAQDAFTKALISQDRKLEADALYNIGNCRYKLGKLKENTDLTAAVNSLRESLDYYKRAVGLDQENKDARFNHEFIERELKILLDKLSKQRQSGEEKKGEERQQEQQKQGERQQQEGEKSGGQSAENGQEKDEGRQREEADQAKEDREKREQEGVSMQEETQKEGEQAEGKKELSEEEARALLERYGREETAPDYMDRRAGSYDREVLKDW